MYKVTHCATEYVLHYVSHIWSNELVCVVWEGCVFSDVKTVTVEPQWVCVPFVHLHRLTQLTAQ